MALRPSQGPIRTFYQDRQVLPMAAIWPTHRRKAALKRPSRRRTIAELAKEQLNREKTYGVRADTYVVTRSMIFLMCVVVCAALTLYCATAIFPLSSTTNVERMTP